MQSNYKTSINPKMVTNASYVSHKKQIHSSNLAIIYVYAMGVKIQWELVQINVQFVEILLQILRKWLLR